MFKHIKIDETNLICYENGIILRQLENKKWKKIENKSKRYWNIKINGKMYLFHRIMMVAFKNFDLNSDLVVDHLDRDIHNNTLSNLAIKTQQENQFNRDAKGYYKKKYIKKDGTESIYWGSRIRINGKDIIKCFKTEDEARIHYLDLKVIHHQVIENIYS